MRRRSGARLGEPHARGGALDGGDLLDHNHPVVKHQDDACRVGNVARLTIGVNEVCQPTLDGHESASCGVASLTNQSSTASRYWITATQRPSGAMRAIRRSAFERVGHPVAPARLGPAGSASAPTVYPRAVPIAPAFARRQRGASIEAMRTSFLLTKA